MSGRMRGRIGIFWASLFAAGFLMAAAAPAAAKVTRIKPTSHAGTVRVRLGKKTSLYHKASATKPVVYEVTGPTRLRILARSLPPDAGKKSQKLSLTIDGKPQKSLTLSRKTSSQAALRGGAKVGTLTTREIEIPAGPHKVFVRAATGSVAALRAYRGAPSRATTWVPFAPEGFARSLRVRSGDAEETWYRFTPQTPATMTIHGPLRLKVSTRVDFDVNAGVTQSYVLRVVVDGKPKESFALKSRASHTVSYPELPEITPGLAREILTSVPAGTHRISFQLEGTTAPGAALRIRAPQSELKKQVKKATPRARGRT